MSKELSAGLLLLLLGTGACRSKEAQDKRPQNTTPIVDVIVAQQSLLPNVIEANGTVLANESVNVYPEVSGRLVYLNIPEGKRVAAGTVLARIFNADLQAQLEQQQVQLALAEKTEQRQRQLLAADNVSQAEVDVAATQTQNLRAGVKLLQAQLSKTIVTAPFDGELGLRLVSPGALVTPQTMLTTLQQTNRLKIDFTLPETYASLATKGKTVAVSTENTNERRRATIIAVEPQINTATRNLRVRALLEGTGLNPGAFAKVLIDESHEGIAVPSNAIIPEAASNKVVVVRGGKGTFVDVQTGVRLADRVEVTKGLSPGDSVVVSGVLFVRPDQSVAIRRVIQPDDKSKVQKVNQ
jgi:membrane fusion protein (multidrug efflux system)